MLFQQNKMKLSTNNKNISNGFSKYLMNIAKVLNFHESTIINLDNEESCKKIKENIGKESSFEDIFQREVLKVN